MFFKRKPYFVSPKSYELASRVERNEVCNGCGPQGYDWFVPDNLLGVNIEECCEIHDWMYKHGVTLKDKKWADLIFYVNMRRAVMFPRCQWLILQRCRLKLAHFYFEMVRDHGLEAFATH